MTRRDAQVGSVTAAIAARFDLGVDPTSVPRLAQEHRLVLS